jgi:AraC-like DNA-binding protein
MKTLFFSAEHIYRLTSIPIRCLDKTGTVTLFNKGYAIENDPFFHTSIKNSVFNSIEKKTKPFLIIEDEVIIYAGFYDLTECVTVIGPITIKELTPEKIYNYAVKHDIFLENFTIIQKSMMDVVSIMSLLYFLRYGRVIQEEALFHASDDEMPPFDDNRGIKIYNTVEREVIHQTHDFERIYLQQIELGDIESLQNNDDKTVNPEHIGMLAKKKLKHYEYMLCISITLSTRAAIKGGLDPETAYSMSDMFLQRLEKCNEIMDMIKLQGDVVYSFTKQVRLAKEKRSSISHVEKCKVYIKQHLSSSFGLDELSIALSINKSYLARKFMQEEGISIMNFTRKKRVEAAANMLRYSDESISKIAEYLCFPTQSHFGKVFKEEMGMTPQKYRASNQTIEFR